MGVVFNESRDELLKQRGFEFAAAVSVVAQENLKPGRRQLIMNLSEIQITLQKIESDAAGGCERVPGSAEWCLFEGRLSRVALYRGLTRYQCAQ